MAAHTWADKYPRIAWTGPYTICVNFRPSSTCRLRTLVHCTRLCSTVCWARFSWDYEFFSVQSTSSWLPDSCLSILSKLQLTGHRIDVQNSGSFCIVHYSQCKFGHDKMFAWRWGLEILHPPRQTTSRRCFPLLFEADWSLPHRTKWYFPCKSVHRLRQQPSATSPPSQCKLWKQQVSKISFFRLSSQNLGN